MSKNLNLPNILALFRIALAPLMLWFFINRDNSLFSSWHPSWFDYFAGLVFVIASVTDFFDGFIPVNISDIYKQWSTCKTHDKSPAKLTDDCTYFIKLDSYSC